MRWYAAHAVLAVGFKDGNPGPISVWENVYLIQANDSEEAERKATALAKAQEGDAEGTFEWEDRPATWKFVGLRKLNLIANSSSVTNEPGDGAEITYQTLRFENRSELDAFMEGEVCVARVVD